MPRTKRRLASEVQRWLAQATPPESPVTDLYAPRPKRRARRDNRTLLGNLERALRRLQQEVIFEITVVGMGESDPVTYEIGNDAYAAVEALRLRISRALS